MFRVLASVGLPYGRSTPAADIHRLFRRLWPADCGFTLTPCGEYLVPAELGAVDTLFSPGVGQCSSFETAFADRGVVCHLADASVDGPAEPHPNFRFRKAFVGPRSEGDVIGFETWVDEVYPAGDRAVLQMDIEGAEYEAILATERATLRRFAMIVVEVHKLNMLTSQEGFALGSLFFDKLLADFVVCHFHVNNYIRPIVYHGLTFPSDIELTLVRRDLVGETKPVEALPHPLDRPATTRKIDPRSWPRFEAGVLVP